MCVIAHSTGSRRTAVVSLGFFVFASMNMSTKICSKCKAVLPISSFGKDKSRKDGLFSWCKQCKQQSDRSNYLSHLDQILSSKKDYYEKNQDTIKRRMKEYYLSNKEVIHSRNKTYYLNNVHVFRALNARRRAALLMAVPAWADKEHIHSLYLIASLNRDVGYDVHVDHIVPLQHKDVCGLHCESNLQLLSSSDNLSKGNRWWPDMWDTV